MKTLNSLFYTLFVSIFVLSCAQNSEESPDILIPPTLPEVSYDYLEHKSNNPTRDISFLYARLQTKGVTNEIATLGRVLFYDTKLSLNNRISCGSCHKQNLGFSDGLKVSKGFNEGLTLRNSMSMSNLLFTNSLFWDKRVDDLNEQVLLPIQDHIEMGLKDMKFLEEKLTKIDYYSPLFESAYGDNIITEERIAESLEKFIQTMLSHDSPFDNDDLSSMQRIGETIFESNCASCHREPSRHSSWINNSAANIGLDINYVDKGVGEWDDNPFSDGTFKIPSLRNIAVTAPYMHDGRFETLDEVIEHYNSGIKNHPNLDWRFQDITGPRRMNLSETDKIALKSFLESFTDFSYMQDPRFSNPFQQ